MNNYRNLEIWKKSMSLVVEIYSSLKTFPRSEHFNTIDQIKRCSISIPSNIAEGAGRNSDKDFIRFLSIANGSACELESLLIISHQLNFIPDELMKTLVYKIQEIQKMNRSLQAYLQKNLKTKD